MFVFIQDGNYNCLLLAAQYGHAELFHHLVQTYLCNPRQKDKQTGVSVEATVVTVKFKRWMDA